MKKYTMVFVMILSVMGCSHSVMSSRDIIEKHVRDQSKFQDNEISQEAIREKQLPIQWHHKRQNYVVDIPGKKPLTIAGYNNFHMEIPIDTYLVFLHGVMSDTNICWSPVMETFHYTYNMIGIDLIGCGSSDIPDPDEYGEKVYSPETNALAVYSILSQIKKDNPKARFALIAHSWGSLVALNMLTSDMYQKQFSDVRSSIVRLVLVSPANACLGHPAPGFLDVMDLSSLKIWIADLLGILESKCAETADAGIDAELDIWKEEREVVKGISAEALQNLLSHSGKLKASQLMLKNAIPLTEKNERDFDAIHEEKRKYQKLDMATLILHGGRDDVIYVASSFELAAYIKKARLRIFKNSKHSVPVMNRHKVTVLLMHFMGWGGADWVKFGILPESMDAYPSYAHQMKF